MVVVAGTPGENDRASNANTGGDDGAIVSGADARTPGVLPPEPSGGDDLRPAADDRAEQLAAALKIRFNDLAWLRLALTHRSVLKDWHAIRQSGGDGPPADWQSNERLEFLGDALLGAIVAEHLFHRYPDAPEGTLTARRVALIRAETLVRWAREIDLGAYLVLGHGEKITAGARDRMLAGAFEALVGAIAIDRGQPAATRFVHRFLLRDIDPVVAELDQANPKGRLQEICQDRWRVSPEYQVLATDGPAHDRLFSVEVRVNGEAVGVGSGRSKRLAEEEAARVALAGMETVAPVVTDRAGGRASRGTGTSRGAKRRRLAQAPETDPGDAETGGTANGDDEPGDGTRVRQGERR